MTRICICGGGNLGHVVAGYLAAQGHCEVDLLTRHPERWKGELLVHTPEGETLHGQIHHISSHPDEYYFVCQASPLPKYCTRSLLSSLRIPLSEVSSPVRDSLRKPCRFFPKVPHSSASSAFRLSQG